MTSVRRALLLLVALVTAATGTTTLTAPAQAAVGNTGSQGFQLTVNAVVTSESGDAGFVPTGSVAVTVPPVCWWETFSTQNLVLSGIDPGDPEAMRKYFLQRSGSGSIGHDYTNYTQPGDGYLTQIENAEKTTDYTWYNVAGREGVNCVDEGFIDKTGDAGAGSLGISYRAWRAGQAPPPPMIDVEDVVEELWDQAQQNIEGPLLDRNPQIAAAGNATLVNLPTWMWVTNQEMALATDGQVDLHVEIPGTPVQADLTSKTDGVAVSSDAGSNNCTVDQATSEWAKGSQDTAGCTIAFDTANYGGWGVSATTNWTGTWTGTDYRGAHGPLPLDAVTATAVTTIPVAESVALVRDAR